MDYCVHPLEIGPYLFSQIGYRSYYLSSYKSQHQWIKSGDIIQFVYGDEKIKVTVESVRIRKKLFKLVNKIDVGKILFDLQKDSFTDLVEKEVIMIKYNMKPNLVLDLDETLIYTFPVPLKGDITDIGSGNIHNFFILTDIFNAYRVYVRPKLPEFIEELSVLYNIYIYSNGMQDYVSQVCENLEHSHKILKIFSRTNPSVLELKNLEKYGLDPAKTVIVDDRIDVWDPRYHRNVIRILKFSFAGNIFTNSFDLELIKNQLHSIHTRYQIDSRDIRDYIL